MKHYTILLLFLFVFQPFFASEDWGATGHRTIGAIASLHLDETVKLKIDTLLAGQSLALVATYADEIKSDNRYKFLGPWHYVNFPFDTTYEKHPKSDKGDIIVAINTCVKILKNPESSKEDKAFYLKLLVHFIGDLHMPLHIGLKEDKGGNDFQVRWFKQGTNLHSVWDFKIIEKYGMSYTELFQNRTVLTSEEIKAIGSGSVIDWMYESRAHCKDIYENTKVGEQLGYEYMYQYTTLVRSQLQKAGIRLAFLLNTIFK